MSERAEESEREVAKLRPVRVVLIDGDEIVCAGVEAVLGRHGDRVRLVGHVSPSEDLAQAASRFRADVVLVHLDDEGSLPLSLVGELVKAHPSLPVVILSEVSDERRLFEALRLGATGYVLRSADSLQLADSLVRASTGTKVVDPELAIRFALRAAHVWDGQGWPGSQLGLSRRQSDVLRLLTEGLSNRRIADELILGEETVKTHLRAIYRVLDVHDRTQAVAFALRQGLFATES